MKMEQSVPKRRHIKFRRRGITQKKIYSLCMFIDIVCLQHLIFTLNSYFSSCIVANPFSSVTSGLYLHIPMSRVLFLHLYLSYFLPLTHSFDKFLCS
jgi:hypothetical protein